MDDVVRAGPGGPDPSPIRSRSRSRPPSSGCPTNTAPSFRRSPWSSPTSRPRRSWRQPAHTGCWASTGACRGPSSAPGTRRSPA
ncbi:MAG: hypothetical protein MZW92_59090 [Comamonadaceae bacterium]|nr:hypothetical protein [Comamonadaceae bacterium]